VLLMFLAFCYVLGCFFCIRDVSCILNVASVSGLSILDLPFDFLKRLYKTTSFLKEIAKSINVLATTRL
jgi:predicted DNA-binding helix-hairpin-helix protein